MSAFRFNSQSEEMQTLLGALGLNSNLVKRVVIDFQVGSPAMVYIEQYADKKILEIIKPSDIQNMQVKILSKEIEDQTKIS
jgi:hypothetical protein